MSISKTPTSEERIKREIRNRRHFSFRINLFFVVTFVVFSVLIINLAILQFVNGPSLKEKELAISTRDVLIPPIRGNVLDREGKPIAYSTSSQSLFYTIEPGTKKAQAQELATRLEAAFRRYGSPTQPLATAEEIYEDMDFEGRTYYPYMQRRLKAGLTKEEIAYFSEHGTEFPGVAVVEESIREYNPEQVAVQLVGYMKQKQGADSLKFYKEMEKNPSDKSLQYLPTEEVGFEGIELMYQTELRGRNGLKTYPVNNESKIVGPMRLTKPVKGDNLYLTINKDIQLATQQAIVDQLAKLKNAAPNTTEYEGRNAKTGYAVAMEVKTGKVVAMASMPSYDPNIWLGGISQKEWDDIQFSILNGTIREAQPPYIDDKERVKHPSSLVYLGSTQKPLTILVGLSEKLITPNTVYDDPGSFTFGAKGYERTVRNANGTANGPLTPTTAIAKSSNVYMMKMVGNALYLRDGAKGVDIWDSYMKRFGLGVTTGSGLPGEYAGFLNYNIAAKTESPQSALVFAAFGQQGRYTPLQLAQYVSTLANRGVRMKPQFVDKVTDFAGNTVRTIEKEVLNEVDFPEQYWTTIEKGMDKVNVQGFEDFKYNFRRKTGTSEQTVGGGVKVENAVFIAYAPAENPKLAVAVVVPEGGYGGWGAAPIARKIFDEYDRVYGLGGGENP